MVGHVREKCLSSTFTALDATRIPVLDSSHPLGIKSGALWLIEGDHKYACFLYAPSGHAKHLKRFFDGRKLQSVMCDGPPTNNCVENRVGARPDRRRTSRGSLLLRQCGISCFARQERDRHWTGRKRQSAFRPGGLARIGARIEAADDGRHQQSILDPCHVATRTGALPSAERKVCVARQVGPRRSQPALRTKLERFAEPAG